MALGIPTHLGPHFLALEQEGLEEKIPSALHPPATQGLGCRSTWQSPGARHSATTQTFHQGHGALGSRAPTWPAGSLPAGMWSCSPGVSTRPALPGCEAAARC